MNIALALVMAYIIGGLCYVWRDLAERNFIRQKPYARRYRQSSDISILLGACAFWPVGLIGNALMRGRLTTYELPPLAAFFGVAILVLLIFK